MANYIRNQETISGQIEDELVMVDIEAGNYFSLNVVATRIWELLENPVSFDELCANLMEEYEVSETQCRADVEAHLSKMQELGLVKKAS